MKPKCLIVDDESDTLLLLDAALSSEMECYTAKSLSEAKFYLTKQEINVCLADMCLGPAENGIELVDIIKSDYPKTVVAGITANGDIPSAVEFLKRGAFDYIQKPVDIKKLKQVIHDVLNLPTTPPKRNIPDFIAKSPQMEELLDQIERVARSQAPVHIYGESGSGKEVIAKKIHKLGARAKKPFIAVNCGAIPHELMESQFFGHKKGSFTGASADHQGFFEQACGGTLLLDEIADLPLHMQAKLLRAIQERQIRPIGGKNDVSVDVRILSATHKNLPKLVQEGEFREDLYFRIYVIPLNVPPLRERKEDIDPLTDRFFSRHPRYGELEISQEAREVLKTYPFPGNVRELENILEHSLTMCKGPVVNGKDILFPPKIESFAKAMSVNNDPDNSNIDDELNRLEKKMLIWAMKKMNGKSTKAANLLGITLNAMRHRLRKHELDKVENWKSFELDN